MKPIRLPEPPGTGMETPEIFTGGGANVVRRAVVMASGSPSAESQCLGLVHALGLADHLALYRVTTRPSWGINEWLHFLPISMHKLIDRVLRQLFRNTRFAIVVQGRKPYRVLNGGYVGLSSVLEVDTKKIVATARDTFDKFSLVPVENYGLASCAGLGTSETTAFYGKGYESREVAEEKWRRHRRKKWRNFLVITTLLLFMVGYVLYFI